MIRIEKVEVSNFAGAFRGLRNPLDSWHLSDSGWKLNEKTQQYEYSLGPKDIDLAQRMINGGTDESKFMRQIFVSFDITAPLYWWKEFDTYKIGTVANSCSTMHKIDSYPIIKNSFCWDNEEEVDDEFNFAVSDVVAECERLRNLFKETKNKKYWRALIQLTPNSWMQKRTITLNYQVLRAMYFARRHHKLTEWHEFCVFIESLPYAFELICYQKPKKKTYTQAEVKKVIDQFMLYADIDYIASEELREFLKEVGVEE